MTSRVPFTVVPSRLGGSGRATNPLTNITMKVEPPEGELRDMLEAYGYPFASEANPAYLTSIIASTYLRLDRAGILDALDWLFISTGDISRSVVNMVPGKTDTVANGVTETGGVMSTDGAASYLAAQLASNGDNFSLNSATSFVYLTETPPGTQSTAPIIGTTSSGDYWRLHRNSGSPFIQLRANESASNTGSDLSPRFEESDWSGGLWAVTRSDSTTVQVHKDGDLLGVWTGVTTTAMPDEIAVGAGSQSTTFEAQSFTAFGGGRALSSDENSDLYSILKEHSDFIQNLY